MRLPPGGSPYIQPWIPQLKSYRARTAFVGITEVKTYRRRTGNRDTPGMPQLGVEGVSSRRELDGVASRYAEAACRPKSKRFYGPGMVCGPRCRSEARRSEGSGLKTARRCAASGQLMLGRRRSWTIRLPELAKFETSKRVYGRASCRSRCRSTSTRAGGAEAGDMGLGDRQT